MRNITARKVNIGDAIRIGEGTAIVTRTLPFKGDVIIWATTPKGFAIDPIWYQEDDTVVLVDVDANEYDVVARVRESVDSARVAPWVSSADDAFWWGPATD